MRITLAQVLLSVCFVGISYANDVHAQSELNQKVNIQVKEETLKKVLSQIEKQVDIRFVFSSKLINSNQKVTANFVAEPLAKVLNNLLQPRLLDYEVSGKIVILKRGSKSINTTPSVSETQIIQKEAVQLPPPFVVKGLITNTEGEPLVGASVILEGTNKGTVTDDNGLFSLELDEVDKTGTLLATYIGYETQKIAIAGQTSINFSLKADSKALNEVVVVGYGERKRASITSAISTVNSDDIDRVHGGSTVSSTLAGKLPGVTFRMPDGRPGASANIQVRNLGNPLFVIDGIQQDAGQFNNLAPNDIESISILKDASAAVYGVRAANGVVVVTTKKGKSGTPNTISVNSFVGFQNWTNFANVLDNSYDYMRYKADAEMNTRGTTGITAEELEKYKAGTEPNYRSFNWRDFIIKSNAPLNSINLSAQGGSERINYYVSGTRLYQNSVLGREYKFGRTNIQSNITAKIAEGLKVGVNINGRIETRDNPGVPGGDDYFLAKFAILRNTPLERPYANDNPEYLNDIKHNESNWAYLNYKIAGKFHNDWRVMQTNFNADYQIPGVPGLTVSGVYSYYIADFLYNNHEYTYKAYTYDKTTDTYKVTGGSTNPWREREQIKQINTTTQGKLHYIQSFGRHSIEATFVAERLKGNRLRNWIHSVPTTNALPLIYFNTADTYQDSDDKEARLGYAGRVNYGFANKYFVELSARRDASYLFAPDKRIGLFPSVSAGWRLSEEGILKKALDKVRITDLKLRASYGVLGDDGTQLGLAPFAYLPGYNYNQGVSILDGVAVVGSRDKGVPVTNISWLKSKMTDIGLDFALFDGKITGSVDYFYRKRTGLRGRKLDILVPSELGYSLPDENINSDAQFGEELSLAYNGNIKKLRFTVGGNISYSRSKFLNSYKPLFFNSLDRYRNSSENRYTKIDWGYEIVGQFKSQEEINNYGVNIDGQGNKTLLPGDLIYKDQNGDNKIDGLDERPIGYGLGTQPNINYGFNLALSYGNFDFHADFSGATGYTWNQNWESRWAFQNDGNLNTIFTDSWRRNNMFDLNSPWTPGYYPANRYNDRNHSNYNRNSSFWFHNVAYLRARTIEFGYSLPTTVLGKKRFQKARIYINAYNLFSIDNLKKFGVDPEVQDDNGLQFPQNKVVNAGINLTF